MTFFTLDILQFENTLNAQFRMLRKQRIKS